MAHRDLPKFNHVDLLFPSKYLKAGDLRGKDVTVTIADIEPRHELKTERGSEEKPLMSFRGAKKGLVLNKTNAKTIAKLYGPEVTEWIGKPITLYAAEVPAFGEVVEAIRVRQKRPAPRNSGANQQRQDAPPPIPPEAAAPSSLDDVPDWDDGGDEEPTFDLETGEEIA